MLGSKKSKKPSDNKPDVKQNNKVLCVCALDFGKTYSGYAYSLRLKPNDIYCPHWNTSTGCTTLINYKTPTTILLYGGHKLIGFGDEAIKKFLDLNVEERKDFNFFQRFQMNLYDKFQSGENLSVTTKIADFNGKQVPAVDVFSTAIKYLKDHFLNENEARGASLLEKDIKWVLTVPAMWGDPEKEFMKQAAKKTGIEKPRLATVLESEAAFIFCKDLPAKNFESGFDNIDVFSLEQRYLVLNAEDGTIDTTVLEVRPGGKLHVLSRASYGDVMVDNTFKQMLIDIVGEEFMDSFRQNNTADYIDMFRAFETKKKEKYKSLNTRNITISPSFLEKYKEENGIDISKRTLETQYAKSLKWAGDKVKINKDLFQSFFDPANDKIVHYIREILSKPEVNETKVILMVGGFSEWEIVQDAIRKAFPECCVLVPLQAGVAVLKGAVLFGHSSISDDDNTPVLEEGDNRPVVALDNTKVNNATEDRRSYAAKKRGAKKCSIL